MDDLLARLRARTIIQLGKPMVIDFGKGPVQTNTCDAVFQVRNPDGEEAAAELEALRAKVERLEDDLHVYQVNCQCNID